MPDGSTIILTLKVLVCTVTLLFAIAVGAILMGHKRLHGWVNTIFFVLTMSTVFGFELLIRIGGDITATFSPEARQALRIHLMFAIPAAVIMPVMFWSGWTQRKRLHLPLAVVFTLVWIGTFITGVFFLPHRG